MAYRSRPTRTRAGVRPSDASSLIVSAHGVARLRAVEYAVVGPTDRAHVALRDRRQRRDAESRSPPCATSKPSVSILCRPVSIDPRHDLQDRRPGWPLARRPASVRLARRPPWRQSTSPHRRSAACAPRAPARRESPSSAYPSLPNNSFSTRAFARSGPDPIAKNSSGLIAQPAYCDAMHASRRDDRSRPERRAMTRRRS